MFKALRLNDNIKVSLVVVKFLSKFVILDMRNCFEQTMTQHTSNQWNNQLHVKYELTLFFGAIGLLNPSNKFK